MKFRWVTPSGPEHLFKHGLRDSVTAGRGSVFWHQRAFVRRTGTRRRGRGNRNQGGANSGNRIDSRARGNAPQLLDKYKKLAQDAQHNGDRVQAEYYLQFADHYFRVIADNKARQDEQRAKRDPDRANDDSDDDGEEDRRNKSKPKRSNRNERQRGSERESSDAEDMSDGDDDDSSDADENPFVRKRSAGSRRTSNARKRKDDTGNDASDDTGGDDGEIDANVLPPAIAAATSGDEPKAKPKLESLDEHHSPTGDLGSLCRRIGAVGRGRCCPQRTDPRRLSGERPSVLSAGPGQ